MINQRYIQSEGPLTADVDDELVMLDPTTSAFFGLAETGARIWALLATPHTIDDLVQQLTTEYDVDSDTCRTQVTRFIEKLDAAGLVRTDHT